MDHDALNGRVALLVDDETFFLSSVVEGLRVVVPGMKVLTASDGIAALEVLDRQPVDVIVTDIQMPRLDGFGLIAELINRGVDSSVIVLTAFERPSLVDRERLSLAIECLEKPLDFDQLIATLIRTMQMRASRQLHGVSLTGLLQTLEMERGNAAIRVSFGQDVVWINVSAGRLVHAKNDSQTGVGIAGQALMWVKPRVEIHLLPRDHERSFDAGISQAMLEAARLDDEAHPRDPPPTPTFQPPPITFPPPPPPTQRTQTIAVEPVAAYTEQIMENIKASLAKTNEITGTLGVALVDFASGMTLGSLGTGINLEVAAAGNMEVMRAKRRVMNDLGISGGIEDILITLDKQYHIIRPISDSLFLYIALDRKQANLAMARHKLAGIAEGLHIE